MTFDDKGSWGVIRRETAPLLKMDVDPLLTPTLILIHYYSLWPYTVSLKEAFGQNNVPPHKNTAGSIRNGSRWFMKVTALAISFHFS